MGKRASVQGRPFALAHACAAAVHKLELRENRLNLESFISLASLDVVK